MARRRLVRQLVSATLMALVSLFGAAARAHAQNPPDPPHMCGDGTLVIPAPSGTVRVPQGCRIYLLVVSDHGRNNQMNDLTFYPLAKWVAENGGYVHWAWWNNLLNEYMAGPLGAPAPYPYPVPPTATEPHPLESFHKFNANPGTPTIAYPGLLERGWWRDGLPSLIALLSAFVEDVLEDAFLQNGVDPVPASDAAFVADARVFLTTIRDFNREALIITVGHGFGASSLNHLFETLTDTEIDLVGLIDPIGSEDSPAARRSDLRTHRGSQWRSRRKFLGYRQADCIRSTTFPFLCYDHAPGLFQWDYRCRPQGVPADTPSGWLDAPPTISSRAPLQCSGPVVHGDD